MAALGGVRGSLRHGVISPECCEPIPVRQQTVSPPLDAPPRIGNNPRHGRAIPRSREHAMDSETLPGTAEDRKAQALIDAAAALLKEQGSKAPREFVTGLFGRAVPEDVLSYDRDTLAALAADAWNFFTERRPGAAKIRIATPPEGRAGPERLRTISVLEIVNDDMPFLVDSV